MSGNRRTYRPERPDPPPEIQLRYHLERFGPPPGTQPRSQPDRMGPARGSQQSYNPERDGRRRNEPYSPGNPNRERGPRPAEPGPDARDGPPVRRDFSYPARRPDEVFEDGSPRRPRSRPADFNAPPERRDFSYPSRELDRDSYEGRSFRTPERPTTPSPWAPDPPSAVPRSSSPAPSSSTSGSFNTARSSSTAHSPSPERSPREAVEMLTTTDLADENRLASVFMPPNSIPYIKYLERHAAGEGAREDILVVQSGSGEPVMVDTGFHAWQVLRRMYRPLTEVQLCLQARYPEAWEEVRIILGNIREG